MPFPGFGGLFVSRLELQVTLNIALSEATGLPSWQSYRSTFNLSHSNLTLVRKALQLDVLVFRARNRSAEDSLLGPRRVFEDDLAQGHELFTTYNGASASTPTAR